MVCSTIGTAQVRGCTRIACRSVSKSNKHGLVINVQDMRSEVLGCSVHGCNMLCHSCLSRWQWTDTRVPCRSCSPWHPKTRTLCDGGWNKLPHRPKTCH